MNMENNNNNNNDIDNKEKFNAMINMYTVFMSIMTGVSQHLIRVKYNMINKDLGGAEFINDLNPLGLQLEFKKLSGVGMSEI